MTGVWVLDDYFARAGLDDYLATLGFIPYYRVWAIPSSVIVFGRCGAMIIDKIAGCIETSSVWSCLGSKSPVGLRHSCGLRDRLNAYLSYSLFPLVS